MSVDFAKLVIQADSSELKLLRDRLKEVEDQAPQTEKKTDNFTKSASKLGKELTIVGAGLTAISGTIIAVGGLSFKAAMDFESGFAGVRKTVEATEEEFAALSDGIRDMAKEMPMAATEIAGIGEAAGQLGIEVPNILGFTKVMADLGVATNMSAETAATSFARFANITGMSQKDFDKLGSVVVNLGNNLATTESEIVSMGMRLAGAGAQIGLTEAQIMSFAGSLSSVGIEAEAGGSAFSKTMIEMQLAVETNSKMLKDYAKVAGMTTKDFKKAFQEDAAGALISFIEGLGSAEERGMSTIKILDDMGIKEIRLRDTLLRAAGASDIFTESLDMGTKAWEENTALTDEAAQRYATTESQLQILKNRLTDTGITLGEVLIPAVMGALDAAEPLFKAIENGAKAFAEMDTAQQRTILTSAGLVTTMGPLLLILPKISAALVAVKTSAVALSAFLLTNPFGVGILALGSLAAAAVSAKNALDDLKTAEQLNFETDNITREVRELWELKTEIEETIQSLENLRGTSFFGPKTQQELADAYNNLEVVKQMLIDTNREIQGLGKDPEPALDDLNKAFKEIEENIRSIVDAQKLEMDAEARAIAELQKRNEAEKEFNALLSEKEQIMNSLISPMDKLAQEQARIIELRKMGILTEYEMIRALKSTEEQMEALIEVENTRLLAFDKAQQRGIDSLYSGLLTQEEEIQQSYDHRRELILNSTAVTEEEKKDLLLRLTEKTNNELKDLNYQQAKDNIGAYEQMFSGIMAATRSFGGEQSDFYKAMFRLQQAAALANAVVAIAQGAAESSKVGWPQNIATIAGHVATTAPILASIAGASFAGEFAGGGRIPSGQWGIVGETGKPEIVHGPATVTGVNETEELLRGRNETHVHFHIGTLVSDGRGEKEFVRRVMPSFQRELQRVGKA